MSAIVETLNHIRRVQHFLGVAIKNLLDRQEVHDLSKLSEPEASVFEQYTPKLRASTYGSAEYKQYLREMGTALEHHYANNSHHPEYFANGVQGMSLLDVLEMLLDWRAATERHHDGSILSSIELNQKRFGYSDELKGILLNTVKELGL